MIYKYIDKTKQNINKYKMHYVVGVSGWYDKWLTY